MASPSPANSPMPPPQAPSPMAPPSQSPAPSPHSPYPHQQPGPLQGPPPPGHPGAYGHPMQHGPPGQGPPGHHMPPHHQGMIFSKGPHMGMQMPPTGPNMSPYQTHGMPPNAPTQPCIVSPGGPPGGPPPPERSSQENLHALQRAIDSMEEKGLQEDPRYSQLLAMRATSKHQHLNGNQVNLLRTQITAYRLLARNKPISMQMQ